jgi:hypothetical protein
MVYQSRLFREANYTYHCQLYQAIQNVRLVMFECSGGGTVPHVRLKDQRNIPSPWLRCCLLVRTFLIPLTKDCWYQPG